MNLFPLPSPPKDTGYSVRMSTAGAVLPVTSSGLSTSGTTVGANTQSSSSGRTEAILCPVRGEQKSSRGFELQRSIITSSSLHEGGLGETGACMHGVMHEGIMVRARSLDGRKEREQKETCRRALGSRRTAVPHLSAQGSIQPQGEGSSGDSRSEQSMESLSAQPGRRCQGWAAHLETPQSETSEGIVIAGVDQG